MLERAIAIHQQGNIAAAENLYLQILRTQPDHFDALHCLGIIRLQQGNIEAAIELISAALRQRPDSAEAHNHLGAALKDRGELDEAMVHFAHALALKPAFAEALNNRGLALAKLRRYQDAAESYGSALALNPQFAEAHHNLATTLTEQGKFDKAVAHYERAVGLRPKFAEARAGLAAALYEQGRYQEATGEFERTLAFRPNWANTRLALCMAQLPILYRDESEIARQRAAYEQHLRALCEDADRGTFGFNLAQAVGSSQPFYLAYQGYNDRELQRLYGSLVCRAMERRYPPQVVAHPPRAGEPVRVGVVSAFFRNHTVWKILIKGWLTKLNPRRFQVFGYHTGALQDAETETAESHCERLVRGPLLLDQWRQAILTDAPHVLLYPEVGMDPMAAQLAAQRLAPAQCNSWGHPVTSGFPTLDYFLSSDLMEPMDGQDHYTERLVRLPNLSTYYEPPDTKPIVLTRSELGLRPSATVFWCGQSLFKYLPQYDQVFPRIALELDDCQFAFIGYSKSLYVTKLFRDRLERAFAAFGSTAEKHCVIWRSLDEHRFMAAMGQCDIVLDSIGWSGGNTSLESLTHGLPIVTMAGPLMRGRHTMAILKIMGITETVVHTIDEYVSLAVRLAKDAPWRTAIADRISARKHRVYLDTTCISALEDFLDSVARGSPER